MFFLMAVTENKLSISLLSGSLVKFRGVKQSSYFAKKKKTIFNEITTSGWIVRIIGSGYKPEVTIWEKPHKIVDDEDSIWVLLHELGKSYLLLLGSSLC